MSQGCCNGCKKVREHVASLLPFKVLESVSDKPLRISGVAMAAGISRNFNVYTSEELQAFASELVGAPMYIEHVAVPNAAGKVTKSWWDPTSRCLMYEAEVYDVDTAAKISKGLIQHVSVGSDYNTLDLADAKIPHGLHNAELSLVAVPGIPETNIHVLEKLVEHLSDHKSSLKEKVKEQSEVSCVFCQASADFLISICQSCFNQFPASTTASPGAQSGVEKLEETELEKLAEKVATKVSDKNSVDTKKLSDELAEAKSKLAESEGKLKTSEASLTEAAGKLGEANKTLEDLRKQLPGGGLLKNPPKMIPVSEHVGVLESLLPPIVVERYSMGMQRQGQLIRAAILKAKGAS
jgi:hypothetical protein